MKYILSTLTAPQLVALTAKNANGSLIITKEIYINGGANVINKKTLITPRGVITQLSDEDFKLLVETKWYKRMHERGYICPCETLTDDENPQKKGLKAKDKSAQMDEKDYEEKSDAKIVKD